MDTQITDSQIIAALGNAGEVAKLLGLSRNTVQSWIVRGIPSKYKVQTHHRALWKRGERKARGLSVVLNNTPTSR